MIQIDIDMPKRCGECPLCVDYDCIIHKRVTDEYYDTLEEQYAHCPLTMPSAQPEKRTNERTETHACDCISRQAAIEEVIMGCPYFSGKNTIDRSKYGTHIGSCDLEFHYKKICPSSECLCAERLGLKNE